MSFWTDLRYGLRLLVKRPGFSLVIVGILGLGIGANAAIFSLVKQVLLRPLPFSEPHRLVKVSGVNAGGKISPLSYPDFLDLRERNRVFETVALVDHGDAVLTGRGEPRQLRSTSVSSEYLRVLGLAPAAGRFFTVEEEQVGRHRSVVLSHGTWQEELGGDLELVGSDITLWGEYVYTVVGVMPPGFEDAILDTAGQADIWRPLAVHPERRFRDGRSYDAAVARLKPGVTLSQAVDDLRRIALELETEYPEENHGRGLVAVDLLEATVGEARPALLMLTVAVGMTLLIACANVANMLLARGATRRREIAVRASLGAGSGRLVRQLMTESVVVAVLAGGLGLLLAAWTTELLVQLASGRLPRLHAVPIDAGLIAFTALASFGTALLCGLVPALQIGRGRHFEPLRAGGSVGAARQRTQKVLTVAEIAIAMTLLIGAGLLVKSLWRLQGVDPGFDSRNVLTLVAGLDAERIPALLERVRSLPGVRHAGVTTMLPLTDDYSCDGFQIDAKPVAPEHEECAEFRVVTSGFFEAMGIPLLRGRLISEQDQADSAPVVVIDEAMAARYWPGEDPLGQRLTKSNGLDISREIVGIVRSVRHFGLDRDVVPQFFEPLSQQEWSNTPIVVAKTESDPSGLIPSLVAEVRGLDANAVTSARTLESIVATSITEPRFRARLIGLSGLLAGLLAAIGVYGVMAFAVDQRTRELGVRMALGARRRMLLRQVLVDGLGLTIAGIGLGLVGALALGRLLRGFLFQVSSLDLATFGAMILLLLTAALLACYLPAHRASRVDPLVALRHE